MDLKRDIVNTIRLFNIMNSTRKTRFFNDDKIVKYKRGEHIISQNSDSSSGFIIIKGLVNVYYGTKHVATRLASDQIFGFRTLYLNEKCNASVVVVKPTSCIKITKENFQYNLKPHLILLEQDYKSFFELVI